MYNLEKDLTIYIAIHFYGTDCGGCSPTPTLTLFVVTSTGFPLIILECLPNSSPHVHCDSDDSDDSSPDESNNKIKMMFKSIWQYVMTSVPYPF